MFLLIHLHLYFHTIPYILKPATKEQINYSNLYFHTIPSILKPFFWYLNENLFILFPYDSVYFKAIVGIMRSKWEELFPYDSVYFKAFAGLPNNPAEARFPYDSVYFKAQRPSTGNSRGDPISIRFRLF